MSAHVEAGALGHLGERGLELLLDGGGHLEVGDVSAGRADQVVMVVRQVLGQLVAGELVRGHDAVHHARSLEHGQVPVRRALGQAGLALEQLRDRQRLVDLRQEVDEGAALRFGT